MKSFKTLLVAAALSAAFVSPAMHAQDQQKKGGRGMPSPEQQVARLDEALTLTADQKTKITAILKSSAEKMQALSQEERREKGREIREEANKEIKALLTPEQQKKFDEMPQGGRGQGGAKKKKGQN